MIRALLLAALLLSGATRPGAAQLAELRIDAGTTTTRHAAMPLDGAAAYPAAALAALGATLMPDRTGARLLIDGDTIHFTAGSPFFRVRDAVHHLAHPARIDGGRLMLPEQFFIEWLPAAYPRLVEYRAGALRTRASAAATASTVAAPPAAQASPRPTSPAAARPSAAARVVVIDPGHGGPDPGKVGVNGMREKDLTLLVSQRLAGILRERGYEVHLTRTTDTLVALADRPRLANRWKDGRPATLFLSIHGNSAESRSAKGFETFFLAEARTEDERRVAEIENAAVRFETEGPKLPATDVDHILNSLRKDFYQRASNDLAEVIQRRLAGFHPGPNRGVKQAGFAVLVGAFMPAVLVEIGFLSNPDDAALLGTSAFQQRIAFGIAEAVDQYFHEHGHLLNEAYR
jgi:N-acetylmuramoyl-L-alanine amidase